MKINTDDVAPGALGALTCGGGFRNSRGFVSLCFHVKLGFDFAFKAELVVAIFALEMAQARELHFVWLGSDTSYMVGHLRERMDMVSWRVKVRWQQVFALYFSHSFRRLTYFLRRK